MSLHTIVLNVVCWGVFGGGVALYSWRWRKKNPETHVKNYFDDNSWGPQ